MLSGGGVATSGRDYRRWRKDDIWQHHIIDPRTSSSAETDIVTATVISENVMKAEAISKASLILGSQKAIPWLNRVAWNGISPHSGRGKNYQKCGIKQPLLE